FSSTTKNTVLNCRAKKMRPSTDRSRFLRSVRRSRFRKSAACINFPRAKLPDRRRACKRSCGNAERAVCPFTMRTLVFCGRTLALRIVPKGDGHAVRITSGGCPTRFLVGTITKSAQDTLCERNFYFVRFWGLGVLGGWGSSDLTYQDVSVDFCPRRILIARLPTRHNATSCKLIIPQTRLAYRCPFAVDSWHDGRRSF